MGLENAVLRRLAVPELTTTVLTMALTRVAADSGLAGGGGSRIGRRGLAIVAMLVGAFGGAVLALKIGSVCRAGHHARSATKSGTRAAATPAGRKSF